MTVTEIAFKLEDLQMQSWKLHSLALAVYGAITDSPCAASNFDGALFLLTGITSKLDQEMKVLSDELFKAAKTQQKSV